MCIAAYMHETWTDGIVLQIYTRAYQVYKSIYGTYMQLRNIIYKRHNMFDPRQLSPTPPTLPHNYSFEHS